MSLYFHSIGLSLAPKNPKSLESGNFTKFSLLPIYINFQLLIWVLGNKDEQLNKQLEKHPLASLRTYLSPFLIPSPLAACGEGDGQGMGVGTLQLAFLCCCSSHTWWLPRQLHSLQDVPPPLSSFAQPPCSGNSPWVAFHPSLYIFRLVRWAVLVFSLCHFVVFTVRFFLINLRKAPVRPKHRINLLRSLQRDARAMPRVSNARGSRAARCMAYRKQDCFFKVSRALQTVHP